MRRAFFRKMTLAAVAAVGFIVATQAFPAMAQQTFTPFTMPESCFNAIYNRAANSSSAPYAVGSSLQEALGISPVEHGTVPVLRLGDYIFVQVYRASGRVIFVRDRLSDAEFYATDEQGNLLRAVLGNPFNSSSWVRLDSSSPHARQEFSRTMAGAWHSAIAQGICAAPG